MTLAEFCQKYEVPTIGTEEEYLPGWQGYVIGYRVVIKNPGFPSNSFSVDPEAETYYNSNLNKKLPLPPLDRYYRSLWWINPVFES
jgi:hypothetical protein